MARIPVMDWTQPNIAEQTIQLFCADEEVESPEKIALKIKRGIGNEGLRRLNASGLSEADTKSYQTMGIL